MLIQFHIPAPSHPSPTFCMRKDNRKRWIRNISQSEYVLSIKMWAINHGFYFSLSILFVSVWEFLCCTHESVCICDLEKYQKNVSRGEGRGKYFDYPQFRHREKKTKMFLRVFFCSAVPHFIIMFQIHNHLSSIVAVWRCSREIILERLHRWTCYDGSCGLLLSD